VEYLSDEWLTAVASAARRVTVDPPSSEKLVVQTVITDVGGPEFAYHLELAGSTLDVQPGRSDSATVTFTQTRDTARAVASGDRSAQEAFMAGDIRVGGDVTALIQRRDSFRAFDEVMTGVAADTEF
jgi:hypothetical protein